MMYRLPAILVAVLLFAGCGTTEDVAENLGVIDDRDDEVVLTTQPQQVTATDAVPRGTVLNVRLVDAITPQTADEGDRFQARVTSDLYASNGDVLVPEGALVNGTITGIDHSVEPGDQAAVRLDFDEIVIWDRRYEIDAEIIETSVETRRDRNIDAEDVGVGAAAGAALGVVLGDDVGDALLGGAIGAGAGTLVSLGTGDEEPVIPSGTVLAIEMDDQISI